MNALRLIPITAICYALLSIPQAHAQNLQNLGFEECFNDQEFYRMAEACDVGDRPAPGWQIAATSTDLDWPCVADPLDGGTFTVNRFGHQGSSYSLRMVDSWDDQSLQVVSEPILCIGGGIFVGTVSVYLEPGLPGETQSAEVGLRFYRGPSLDDESEVYDLVSTVETGRWVTLTTEATTPWWGDYVRLMISSSAAAEQVAYFDPQSLVRLVHNGRFSLGRAGQVPRSWISLQAETAERSPDSRAWVTKRQPESLLELAAYHGCAVSHGVLECWGNNQNYQIGANIPQYGRPWPGIVENLPGPVVQFSTGDHHSCVINDLGELWCWGHDGFGQLGRGESNEELRVPVRVDGINGEVIAVTAGRFHTCAVDDTGGAWCWGDNALRQLGNNTGVKSSAVPLPVYGLDSGVVDIKAGPYHTCALLEGGRLLCWGKNEYGQIGDGTDDYFKPLPAQVWLLDRGVRNFALGQYHTCAVMDSGIAKCWGSDHWGMLGDDDGGGDQSIPTKVQGLTDVADISAGFSHTCALMADSTVKCWGSNRGGQLGISTDERVYWVPSETAVQGAVNLQCGGHHTCAVLHSGELLCWGSDSSGQVGNHYPRKTEPFPVHVKHMGLTSGTESPAIAVVPNKTYRASAKGVIEGDDPQSGALMSIVFKDPAKKILAISDPVQVTALSPDDPEAAISLDVQPPPDATRAVVWLYYPYEYGTPGWRTAFDDVQLDEAQEEQPIYTNFFTCGSDLDDACGESWDDFTLGSDGCAGYLDCDTQCVDPYICFTGECHHELQ